MGNQWVPFFTGRRALIIITSPARQSFLTTGDATDLFKVIEEEQTAGRKIFSKS
jgi:hypothetical protein